MGDLSQHFSKSELECRCGCGTCNLHPFLLPALEDFRAALGKICGKEVPVHVSSGCRCEKHNAEEGGARNSQHLRGRAADVHCEGVSLEQMFEAALCVPNLRFGGIGIYEPGNGSFLHLDVRGYKSRWLNKGTQSLSQKWQRLENEVRRKYAWT